MPQKSAGTTKKQGDTSKVFVTGAMLGAAAALVFVANAQDKAKRKKMRGWALRARGEILEKIENTQAITKDRYEEIVSQVMRKYEKTKSTTEAEVKSLERDLHRSWRHIVAELPAAKQDILTGVRRLDPRQGAKSAATAKSSENK
jgi:hypothetical protein